MKSNYRLIILQGISGSGKSTFAHQYIEEHQDEPWEIVSRDSIREQLLGKQNLEKYFEQGQNSAIEEEVTKREHLTIVQHLKKGDNVIVDNTNTRRRYVTEYYKLGLDSGLTFDQIQLCPFFLIDVDEAFRRVQGRGERIVSKDVIQHQIDSLRNFSLGDIEKDLKNYIPKKWFFPPFSVWKAKHDSELLPKAIICDIDGTLAHRSLLTEPFIHYRSFYDYAKCGTDTVDTFVADVVKGLWKQDYIIIFVSGRKSSCLQETKEFIERATGFKEQDYWLFMRDESVDVHKNPKTGKIEDDPDDKVKYRLYNEYIRDNFNVIGAIDDRKRVVALWETLGLRVLNVGLLNEEF